MLSPNTIQGKFYAILTSASAYDIMETRDDTLQLSYATTPSLLSYSAVQQLCLKGSRLYAPLDIACFPSFPSCGRSVPQGRSRCPTENSQVPNFAIASCWLLHAPPRSLLILFSLDLQVLHSTASPD